MRITVLLGAVFTLSVADAVAACPPFPGPEREPLGGPRGSVMQGRPIRVAPRPHAPLPKGPLSGVRIGLARSDCYGSCPRYSVALRGTGAGRYSGYGYVLIDGDHRFKVPQAQVRCLVEAFRAADFWSQADRYRAPITDNPTTVITLEIGGRRKSVTDYVGRAVGMPPVVEALEAEIDRVGADRFTVGTADTVPDLAAERFDFRSTAAGTLVANAAARAPDDVALALLARGAPATGRVALEPLGGSPRGRDGVSAVEAAGRRGRAVVVRALIDAGALATGEAGIKEAALRAAAGSGDVTTLLEILAQHPNVNARDADGGAVLTNAAGSNDPATVAEILKYRPDVDARAPNGVTALMAVTRGASDPPPPDLPARQAAVVRLLLAAGADVRPRDDDGATALFYARSAEAVRSLVKAGADLEARDGMGDTPLLAAESDEAALALIEAGADPRAVNDAGKSVLDDAGTSGWVRTLAWLRDHGVRR